MHLCSISQINPYRLIPHLLKLALLPSCQFKYLQRNSLNKHSSILGKQLFKHVQVTQISLGISDLQRLELLHVQQVLRCPFDLALLARA
jgi:hypothetical protein